MHELRITEDLIRSLQEKIKAQKNIRLVKKVYIRMGKMSGVGDEALKFWFERLTGETKFKGAYLEISLVEGRDFIVDSLEVE